jgi:hypothetical protein
MFDRTPRGRLSRLLIVPLSLIPPAALWFLTACAATGAGSAAHPTRIRMLPGAISVQVPGMYDAHNKAGAFYVLGAKTGDRMIVNLISRTKGFATGGEVRAPSGKQDGQHGGIIFSARLTETGDYRIRVGPNFMAGTRETGAFVLEVVVLPTTLRF